MEESSPGSVVRSQGEDERDEFVGCQLSVCSALGTRHLALETGNEGRGTGYEEL